MRVDYGSSIIREIYGGDPREAPIYSITEVSRYIKVHEDTLRAWLYGRPYLRRGVRVVSKPIIHLPHPGDPRLSFYNLVEAFNLSSLTRIDGIPFKNIRTAIETAQLESKSPHPLFDKQFWTDSIYLFSKDSEGTYNLSKGGQRVFEQVIGIYLQRVVRHQLDLSPLQVYPFSREIKFNVFKQEPDKQKLLENAPRHIEVDPLIAFGRPTVTGTGIPVEIIASRRRAGDSAVFIAKDYGITEEQVHEAIYYDRESKKVA